MFSIANIKFSTTNSGTKYKNRDDLLLVTLPEKTKVAGVFTKSTTAAASVEIGRENLKQKNARALFVNAGNANAFTGVDGIIDTKKINNSVAQILNCNADEIFSSSTGVIGEKLPSDKIISRLPYLFDNLEKDGLEKAANAIKTTDTFAKFISKKLQINGNEIIINGIAKGSGMIAPNMATMLGYIFTNANISADNLQQILSSSSDKSFNSITVDSDTSTNDTVFAFATGMGAEITGEDLEIFKSVFEEVSLELAKMIVIDGEGATKLIEVEVNGANSNCAAKNIALTIANSPLVKTAIAGEDPNWGRIIMAVGKSGEAISKENIDIKIGEFQIVKNSQLIKNYDEKPVHQYLTGKEVKIFVDVNVGQGSWKVWTCDLTEGYIKINKDYRS
ncbi:MAG: glutamate N-acetyltransferase/amino-acid N-acetyltransferase [Lentimonas sp.]|jgi:glutamate N-acetyltransferase/amino-acid N-acetyltransferase